MTGIKPDRRQVIRAGAWTVPAIALASTAPAFASSGANLGESAVTSASRPGSQVGRIVLGLKNTGSDTTALKVTFTVSNLAAQPSSPTPPQPPAGWTITAIDTTAGTIEYTASAQLTSAEGVRPVTFNIQRSSNGATSGTVKIDPGNGSVVNLTYTFS